MPRTSPKTWVWELPAGTQGGGPVELANVVIWAALCTSVWKLAETTFASFWSVSSADTVVWLEKTAIKPTATAPNTRGMIAVAMISSMRVNPPSERS